MRPQCPQCKSQAPESAARSRVTKAGRFFRKSDGLAVARFHCHACGRGFSEATLDPCYLQNKRHLNESVFLALSSGVSLRRTARLLRASRTTVARKLIFLGCQAKRVLDDFLKQQTELKEFIFDELETFEHTKCKPLSVHLGVTAERYILGFTLAPMPAKGKLSRLARKKYGPRADQRPIARERFLKRIEPHLAPTAHVKSDKNPFYPKAIDKFLPGRAHTPFKGRRGCVVGQGELKRGGFDPLFSLNHTCAMLRANINRLFRRTWCTTKKVANLEHHIAIYAVFHNQLVKEHLSKKARPSA